ncbi:AAA family ATPase [Marinilabilia rubra]|uniref:histidine kinase n=1 Tax=Marinilabilia rubra TaxID=2162893 RepID=A0A2U2B8T9_9BACT|nr:AAA family ATPase [Marinilabilia rubra]PWD99456.1 hypothetical protein DDZ16_10640 [Marinilabilia rubra]
MEQPAIPLKLYGRQKEIKTLLESFEQLSAGLGQILLIPGHSGVGKTALVQELKGPVSLRNGFFVSGKFEQYQQNIPFFPFRQAIADLCNKLQSGSATENERIKTEILDALGDLGQVLIDFFPEFESLIGPQPALTTVSPQEARHRFADVFQKFLKVICRPEHPLVLFIDDWQWADVASCGLIRQLQIGTSLRYFLIIASYRDNEIDKGHQLFSALNELKSRNVIIEKLPVYNITRKDVQTLIKDSFLPEVINAGALSELVHSVTKGNPFFVRSFINYFHESGNIWFNPRKNIWAWNIEKSVSKSLPTNAVDLFAIKLRKLPANHQNLYFLAACLGNTFDLNVLSIISGYTPEQCQEYFLSNEGEMLVFRLDEDSSREDASFLKGPILFKFIHDKVQQAAFTLVSGGKLPSIKLKIGRLLIDKLGYQQLDERLFEIMDAFNQAIHLITHEEEKEKVVRYNLAASKKAYTATAYKSALNFCRAIDPFFEDESFKTRQWQKNHRLMVDLYKQRANCEFLEGDRNNAVEMLMEAVANAETAIEKAGILNILIIHYTLMARYPEAIKWGKQALDALGISLPSDNYEKVRNKEIAIVREAIGGRTVESLSHLPIMDNPEMLTASGILITMGPPCYRSHQKLWSVIVPKVVNLTLRYGNIPQVGYSHTAFGGLVAWVDNDFKTTKAFSELAVKLMSETFQSPSDQSIFYLMQGSSITHWFKHLKYSCSDYKDAYEAGLRSGNLQYAAYAFGHNMYCRFFQGTELSTLMQETIHSLEFSKARLNHWAIDLLEGGMKIFEFLSSEKTNGSSIQIEDTVYLKKVEEHRNIQVKCIYNILKIYSLYILGNHKEALRIIEETEDILYTVGTQGLLPWPEFESLRVLVNFSNYQEFNPNKQQTIIRQLKKSINLLKLWAQNSPENYEHKYQLALAEMAKIEGNTNTAAECFDKALKGATKEGFINWEGIINEKYFQFWQELNNEMLAKYYWKEAYSGFSRWGARAKVVVMEHTYRKSMERRLGMKSLSEDIRSNLINNQIKELRDYALQKQDRFLRNKAEDHVGELAHATKRLRIEIAERKKAQEEIKKKNEELQLLNATKDKFFSIIAHDLKSPFNAILGFSDLLRQKAVEKDYETIKKYSSVINSSANQAMNLLINLMDWARSQTGRMSFNPEKIDLIELLEELKKLFNIPLEQKSITLEINLENNNLIYADKAMINTILRNLLSNAIKFTENEGTIKVYSQKNGNGSELTISDSGVGIPQEKLKTLFRIEENKSTPGTNNEKGTGLGLILSKELVEKHGGKIWAESNEGRGSDFQFTIPDSPA